MTAHPSLFISVLILISTLRLLRDVVHVIMEGVPRDIDLAKVGRTLAGVAGVHHVHDLHIWSLDSSTYAVSAHVVVIRMTDWEAVLASEFQTSHATLQPEDDRTFASQCADGSCGPVYS